MESRLGFCDLANGGVPERIGQAYTTLVTGQLPICVLPFSDVKERMYRFRPLIEQS